MATNLTPEEETYLHDLLRSQSRGIPTLKISANLLLLFGGLLLILTAFYLLQHRTDSAVYLVALPNFIGGMLLIIAYQLLSKRAAQLKKLSALLSKLSGRTVAAS